jgi:hypothetical protein
MSLPDTCVWQEPLHGVNGVCSSCTDPYDGLYEAFEQNFEKECERETTNRVFEFAMGLAALDLPVLVQVHILEYYFGGYPLWHTPGENWAMLKFCKQAQMTKSCIENEIAGDDLGHIAAKSGGD